MKLSVCLPFALGNRLPDFLANNDGLLVSKYGPSLCESDECPKLDPSISHTHELNDGDISTTGCSKDYKNSLLSARLDRCDHYNLDQVDCVKWVTDELNRACGSGHNCVQTKWSGSSGWGHYWGYSSK